jgi:hypothetical protein
MPSIPRRRYPTRASFFNGSRPILWLTRGMLGDLDFADKKESPGCQAADLMLGGVIRQERTEHGIKPSMIEQSSFADITQPVNSDDLATFRIPVTRVVPESLRKNMFVEADIRREWWTSHHNVVVAPSFGVCVV